MKYALVINTVIEKLTATILCDGAPAYHCEYFERRKNALKIDTIIQDAFKTCDIEFEDIKEFYAFCGPGSFTGIKLGLSLSYAMIASAGSDIKKYGLSMLDYSLFDAFEKIKNNKTALAVIPGVRGEYFCRLIKNHGGDIKKSFDKAGRESVASSDEIAGGIKPALLIADENSRALFADDKLGGYKNDSLFLSSLRPKKIADYINYCITTDNSRLLELGPIYLKDTYAVKPKIMTA